MLGYILQRDYRGKVKTYETQKLLYTAEEMGMDVALKDPSAFDIIVTRDDRKSVMVNKVSTRIPDFIFPRMGATTTYFAFAVIRHFEKLGVFSVNPSGSIETVKDKLYQMQILAQKEIPVPNTVFARFPVDVDMIEKRLGFPTVIKTLSGSQGSGVYLANDKSNFDDFMQMVHSTNSKTNLIVQEYIESSRGRDLRVYVLGDKVLGAMQRKSNDDSFKANFSRGGSVEGFKISEEVEEMCINIAKIFNLDIAGVDLLFDKDGNFKVCEVNSSPGFKGMEQATGTDIAKEVMLFIQDKVKNRS